MDEKEIKDQFGAKEIYKSKKTNRKQPFHRDQARQRRVRETGCIQRQFTGNQKEGHVELFPFTASGKG